MSMDIIKPDIIHVIGQRVELRRAGKEFVGLCPFHADKTPSFSVNDDIGVFHCFGCGESGDVIDFVRKLDGLSFTEARKALGIASTGPRLALTPARRRAAACAAAWVNEQSAKLNVMIADTMALRDTADEIGAFDVAEVFDRELVMLREFCDALKYPRSAGELLGMRGSIDKITAGAGVTL